VAQLALEIEGGSYTYHQT